MDNEDKAKLISILNQLFTEKELHQRAFNRFLMGDSNLLFEELRVAVKYTAYDLECTKRELEKVKKQLKK